MKIFSLLGSITIWIFSLLACRLLSTIVLNQNLSMLDHATAVFRINLNISYLKRKEYAHNLHDHMCNQSVHQERRYISRLYPNG